MALEENEIVLCTVKRIEGTTVFLEIDGNGDGAMSFSEVSPGRIRNIREFVFPGKKIVCKVLRTRPNVELSLRRVTGKERKDLQDKYKKEKVMQSIIQPVLKDKTPQVMQKIKEEYDLSDFLDQAKENPELIKKFVPKESFEQLKKIFSEKKEKEKEAKKTITIKSDHESGINEIKSILDTKEAEVRYLGASRFSVQTKAKDYKTANILLENAIKQMQEKAKTKKLHFEVKEK